MKNCNRLLSALAVLLILLTGQGLVFAGGSREAGSGQPVSDWKFRDFTAIDVSAGLSADVKIAQSFSIHALGAPEDLERLKVELDGSTLRLGVKPQMFFQSMGKVTFQITLPALENLGLSGAASCILLWDKTEIKGFNISLSGGSRLKGTFLARNFKADLSGAAQAELLGNAENVDADLSGSSDLSAERVTCKNARVDLSGASHARLKVSGNLDCHASGASTMTWFGTPQVKSDTSGSSNVVSGE